MNLNHQPEANSQPLYFAYGSNLNLLELRQTLVAAGIPAEAFSPIKSAQLPDMMLSFNYFSYSRGGGALNIVPKRGHRVTGYLFQVSAAAWKMIDAKEGHPEVYRRTLVMAIDEAGHYVPAITYVVTPDNEQDFVPPTEAYLKICVDGRRALGIEKETIIAASRNEPNGALNSVFCYGTLMRGESRFSSIERHRPRCVILAEANGRLLDCGEFPGLISTDGQHVFVRGEYFMFRDIEVALRDLDVIEGFDGPLAQSNLYRRTILDVGVGEGRVRTAWAYQLCDEFRPDLVPQDWRESQGRAEIAYTKLVDLHSGENPDRFFMRLTNLLMRWQPKTDLPTPALVRAEVIEGLANGTISERRMAQASGLWAAGVAPRSIW
jgi:gamma-glutamylcyclotransferase (GGCT)/AIG2-like uncharacterized protein YtfP